MKGNKGEWSELYTFFKLLSEGKLYSADENLNSTDSYVEIRSVKREDSGDSLEFNIKKSGSINIINIDSQKKTLSFPKSKAKEIAQRLVEGITKGKSINEGLQSEIQALNISQVKQKSQDKGDIDILIYDPTHGIASNQKFSIKSFLGSDPTLFNANKTTNIRYRVKNKQGAVSVDHINEVNGIAKGNKYIDRINKLIDLGYKIDFDSYEDDTFRLNLQVIDSDLPEIIAHVVLDKYVSRITHITEVIEKLRASNPMKYDLSQGHEFYQYRIVNFLVEAALGMTSKSVWSGKYDVVGGIIIVKPDADILCYHLIDFNKFRQYLKKACRLDNPSGSRMGYGEVYSEEDKSFIKLNFQIKA